MRVRSDKFVSVKSLPIMYILSTIIKLNKSNLHKNLIYSNNYYFIHHSGVKSPSFMIVPVFKSFIISMSLYFPFGIN